MYNQSINNLKNRDIDKIFFSITVISQQINFNDGNGYIYKRNIDILIGCNIHGVRKYITSVFEDEFSKTSDWYNLLLELKNKGLKHVFFLTTDNDIIIKAFKLAFTDVNSLFYIFNNLNNLSHYITFSYSNNIISKIKNICYSDDIIQFNLEKDDLLNNYIDLPFITDLLNNIFEQLIPYFQYPTTIRKQLLSLYFIRDIKKKTNSLSNTKKHFFSIDEFIELFIPTINVFETRMNCGHNEWNEIINFLYKKNKELLLCEL